MLTLFFKVSSMVSLRLKEMGRGDSPSALTMRGCRNIKKAKMLPITTLLIKLIILLTPNCKK
jgi:hypothetical protein